MSYLPVDPQACEACSLETFCTVMSSILDIHTLYFVKPLSILMELLKSTELSLPCFAKRYAQSPPVLTKVDFRKLKYHIVAHDRFSPCRSFAALQRRRTRQ